MSVNFTVGLLCYNSRAETLECLPYLFAECAKFKALFGASLYLVVVDNGTDGVGGAILEAAPKGLFIHAGCETYPSNIGQGAGRNRIVEQSYGSDYILMLDSDIRVVANSFEHMYSHMKANPSLGCVTPHPSRQTRSPEIATKNMKGIEFILNDCKTACTGYALYRTRVFGNSCFPHIRFEDSGPFAGPGWGLEDDDIYLQLTTNGWGVDYFVGIIYLQRKPRSSWKHIEAQGVNVLQKFQERKEFFLEKWKTKGVDRATLLVVQGQDLNNLRA